MKPNSFKRAINDALIGGQSVMFALRCEFHAEKSPIWENDTWEVIILESVDSIFASNGPKLLHIIHRNTSFSSRSDTKIWVRIKRQCVFYGAVFYWVLKKGKICFPGSKFFPVREDSKCQ